MDDIDVIGEIIIVAEEVVTLQSKEDMQTIHLNLINLVLTRSVSVIDDVIMAASLDGVSVCANVAGNCQQ